MGNKVCNVQFYIILMIFVLFECQILVVLCINKKSLKRPSFSSNSTSIPSLRKRNSKNNINSKFSPLRSSPVTNNLSQNSMELDHFILNNNL